MKRTILIIVGCLLIVLSLFLAYQIKYNHFYEILLLGMFLALLPLSNFKINTKKVLYLYLIFLMAGCIGDLFLGQWLFNLWSYTNFNIIEYLILYLFVYPLGGFVVLLSYLAISKNITINQEEKIKSTIIVFFYLFIGLILLFITMLTVPSVNIITFGLIAFGAITLTEILNNKKGKKTIVALLTKNPLKIGLLLFLVTFANALIHEHPNVLAKEWVYNSILFKVTLLDMPVIVLFGWIILTFTSIICYYMIFDESEEIKN